MKRKRIREIHYKSRKDWQWVELTLDESDEREIVIQIDDSLSPDVEVCSCLIEDECTHFTRRDAEAFQAIELIIKPPLSISLTIGNFTRWVYDVRIPGLVDSVRGAREEKQETEK